MFKFQKLISSNYLFQIPVIFLRSDKLFPLIGAVALVLAIAFRFAASKASNPVDRRIRMRFYHMLLTLGLWEIIWLGFRYQNIQFFGTHFVALCGIVVAIIWFVFICIDIFKNYKTQKESWEKEQVKMKYLPK